MFLLLIPYTLLLVLEGARFFLLSVCLESQADFPHHSLYRFKESNIKWYRLLLHSFKDWLVLGVLGTIAVWALRGHVALLLPVGLASLGLLVLLRSYAPVVLWLLAAGVRVPSFFLKPALHLALPSLGAERRRVYFWSAAFVLTGTACLWGWYVGGGASSLLWSLVTLVLGFTSLIRASMPNCQESQA